MGDAQLPAPKRRRIGGDGVGLATRTANQEPAHGIPQSPRISSDSVQAQVTSVQRPVPGDEIASHAQTETDEPDPRPSSPNRHHLSAATTPCSHSSQVDSEDSYPPSASSPPPTPTAPTCPPEVRYQLKLVLHGHKRGVSTVKFSPNGKWIASCSADATVKVWSTSTGVLQHSLHGHLAGISTLAWAPDSAVIASGSDDKTIRLWDAIKGTPHMTTTENGSKTPRGPLLGHHNYVYSLAFSPKGNMLVSSSYDEAVYLWDVRSGTLLRTLPAHSDPIGGVDFVRDGTLIASCASDGLIRVWDTATGQCLRTFFHEDTPPVVSVRFSPNGKYIIAWMLDNCLRMWNYVDGRCVKTYQGHVNQKFSLGGAFGTYGGDSAMPVTSTASFVDRGQKKADPTRAFVTSGSEDGTVLIWDVVSKNVLQKLHGHEDVVLWVDTHPTEKMIVSCGLDRTIRIWRDDIDGLVFTG